MTLIAGTVAWKGVCIAADTRGTHTNHTPPDYSDDLQKIDMLSQGLGIAVAGNCDTAAIFREILIRNLDANEQTDDSYDGPARIVKEIIESSLREMALDQRVFRKPSEQTYIAGFIAGIDRGTSLHLNTQECQRLLEVVGDRSIESTIWNEYKEQIHSCAQGEIDYFELSDLPNSMLFRFESKLAAGNSTGILEVERVPFCEIAVYGSGISSDHNVQQNLTLDYILFRTEPDQIDNAAFHLLRTHGWSERVVAPDPRYNFQTFGGGYLSGAFLENPDQAGYVMFRVSIGEVYRNPERTDLVCSVYANEEDKLCVRTSEGRDWVLKKFWEYNNKVNLLL